MKLSYLLVFAIIATVQDSCVNREKPSTPVHDFTLSVEFIPALFRTGFCTIQKDGTNSTISLDFVYRLKSWIPKDTINARRDIKKYLATFNRYFYGDTLLLDSVETISIEREKMENFIKNLHSDLLNQNDINKDIVVTDGFTILFNYKTDSTNHSFIYRTLRLNDTTQYRIIKKIVSFMDENLKARKSKRYTKTWKEIL